MRKVTLGMICCLAGGAGWIAAYGPGAGAARPACGNARLEVRTLTDRAAAQVAPEPEDRDVGDLTRTPPRKTGRTTPRRGSIEKATHRVEASLVAGSRTRE